MSVGAIAVQWEVLTLTGGNTILTGTRLTQGYHTQILVQELRRA